jgi:hypothetical protein
MAKSAPSSGKALAFLVAHKKTAAIVVVVLVAAFVVSHIASGKASAWRQETSSDQAQASQDELAYQIGEAARLHAGALRHELATADVAVPVGEDQPSLVASLGGLASNCGVAWSASSWSAVPGTGAPGAGASGTGGGSLTAWTVQVSFAGPVGAMQCTLQGLPHMARAVGVTDVDLSYEGGNQVQANVSLNVYGRSSARW